MIRLIDGIFGSLVIDIEQALLLVLCRRRIPQESRKRKLCKFFVVRASVLGKIYVCRLVLSAANIDINCWIPVFEFFRRFRKALLRPKTSGRKLVLFIKYLTVLV